METFRQKVAMKLHPYDKQQSFFIQHEPSLKEILQPELIFPEVKQRMIIYKL